jgi:phenylacetate-CoA ligase
VEFAHRHSPFYQERLQPLFRGGEAADLGAWRDIPLLRRADLENDIDRINPKDIPADFGRVTTLRTSGSSGSRLSFRTCMLARIAAECMMHRLYEWHGFDTTRAMASIRWYGSRQRQYPDGITEERWSFAGERGPHHTLDLRHPVPDLVEWLLRRGPSYLLTFPSVAYDIAQFCAGRCGAVTKIVGISEVVTPEIRTVVRDRIGCDIAQIYACSEMGCIALQSPLDDSYFACEETVLVEILDKSGEPVRPGETGRVVLTSLYNYATPFIRYEIGDWATLAAEPCPSGRALMHIARIDGRARNALRGKNGRKVWPQELPASELNRLLGASSFQVRQRADRKLEIRFVPIGAENSDAASVTAALAGLLGYAADVALIAVDAIARTSGGKRELIVSEID